MKFKTSVSLMVAVVLGLVTAKVGHDLVTRGGTARKVPAAKIIVAARDMEPGHVITEADVALTEIPQHLLPETAIRDRKLAVGRTVLATAARNYPILESVLSAPGAAGGMQAMIPPGMRAVTVDVSESGGVAGLITPGCSVDVISTLRKDDSVYAKTVVENVKVQFIQRSRVSGSSRSQGSALAAQQGPVKTVTLVVTPRQAMMLEVALLSGKPRLILRGNSDTSSSADLTVSHDQVLGLPEEEEPAPLPVAPVPIAIEPPPAPVAPEMPAAAPDPAANRRKVEIIRGGGREVEELYYDQEGQPQNAAPQEVPPTGTAEDRTGGEPAPVSAGNGSSRNDAGESSRNNADTETDVTPRGEANLRRYARQQQRAR